MRMRHESARTGRVGGGARAVGSRRFLSLQLGCTNVIWIEELRSGNFVASTGKSLKGDRIGWFSRVSIENGAGNAERLACAR